jgi:hypothetical protein
MTDGFAEARMVTPPPNTNVRFINFWRFTYFRDLSTFREDGEAHGGRLP